MSLSEFSSLQTQVLWAAFAVSVVFGAVAQKTHFCTMGAVSDIVNMGEWSRMRMWLLAIGTAILGAAALHASGLAHEHREVVLKNKPAHMSEAMWDQVRPSMARVFLATQSSA